MVSGPEQIEMLIGANLPSPVTVWLKADSGMHRLGFVGAELRQAYERLQRLDHVRDEIVLATHFACADELERDVTQRQMNAFTAMTAGIDAPYSLANSAAVLGWPATHSDYTRPGIMLYGSSPFAQPHPEADQLQAVMSLTSTVIGLRTVERGESVGYGGSWTAERRSVIATIAMGYGDGYPRTTPNGTPVMVNGQRCPLAGRVSMDMITVDVTDLDTVQAGDRAELWGKNLSLNEVATFAGTIGYELVTRMPLRTPRVYING
jgi:alanine racemase